MQRTRKSRRPIPTLAQGRRAIEAFFPAAPERTANGHETQLGGGPERAQTVVLVQHRQAEDRHDRVADELLDGPAVCADHRPGLGVPAGHDLAEGLWVEPLAELVEPTTSEKTTVTVLRASDGCAAWSGAPQCRQNRARRVLLIAGRATRHAGV
jgi:hypothetical protein